MCLFQKYLIAELKSILYDVLHNKKYGLLTSLRIQPILPKVEKETNKMILRAESNGRPIRNGKQISVGDKSYLTY